ncbi:MAG: hypothetical protein IAE89_16815 [Anaerolineae bacterium]|nr:hypothetical protein [Anaerolineae bacterium]
MERIETFAPVRWTRVHPRLAAWIILSLGMIILLVVEARDVGLLPGQWLALLAACVLVAGACIWIISWEDSDDHEIVEASSAPQVAAEPPAAAALENDHDQSVDSALPPPV